jgi:DNA mismatch repair protein MutS
MGKVDLHVWYRQYQKLKAQNADTILLYRLGDFYEVFDDDAKLVAEVLEVTLTRKEYATEKSSAKGASKKLYCPMAGMPYHAVEGYVARLVSQGYRVAIAEQLSETASSKNDTRPRSVFASGLEQTERQRGIVHREIVRVITPGTVIDPSMLSTTQNNYLAAVVVEGDHIGLSYTDLSTGEFAATEFSGERAAAHLEGELVRLQVSEVLVPDNEHWRLPGLAPSSKRLSHDLEPMTRQERDLLLPHERVARRLEQESNARWAHGHVTATPDWYWELQTAYDALQQQFGVQSLAGLGLEQRPLAARAAGAVLQYLKDTQRGRVSQIALLRVYTTGAFMFLDPQTRRNLELLEGSSGKAKQSLVSVLDYTRTPMGARLLRRWLSQPLLNLGALHKRQEAVACCVDDGMLRAELREALRSVGDMERVVNRLIQGNGVATPRDLVYLRQALRALPTVIAAVGKHDILVRIEDEEAILKMARVGTGQQHEPAAIAEPSQPWGTSPTADSRVSEHQSTTSSSVSPAKRASKSPAPRVAGDDLFESGETVGEEGTSDQPPEHSGSTDLEQARTGHGSDTAPAATTSAAAPDEQAGVPREQEATDPIAPLDPCSAALEVLECGLDDEPPALLGASNYLRGDDSGDSDDKPRRVIRPGYDERIDQVVKASREAQHYINTLESRERERTGIKSLKVDYNKVFGYFIGVPRAVSNQVPAHYERKQTLVNAERYITAELKEYESVILNAQQRLVEYEREAFGRMCRELRQSSEQLRTTAQTLARIDVVASLAEAAVRGRYTRPTLSDSNELRIVGGRHPVVEKVLDEAFVPNDTQVDTNEQQVLVITGPNMAGKSTVLRQVALVVLLAQIGSFVPAEAAEVGLVDRIFTRIGAQDDIATGQSTFMVEMTETASLLMQSTGRSLIILDEVGRGTSTYDGMAIARAVVEYIHNEPRLRCRTLFATHYHELTDLEKLLPRVKNYHMAAIEQQGQVVFLYELRRGSADRSYGIHVAELAGIPRAVIRRASELLAQLENHGQSKQSGDLPPQPPQHARPTASAENQEKQPEQDTMQLSLFDVAPNPVVEYIKRLNVNELTPLDALNKLYELQKIAQRPLEDKDLCK